MPLPIQIQVSFNDPCYLIYADTTGHTTASLALYDLDEITLVTLNSQTFTRVKGTIFKVSITPRGGVPKDYPPDAMASFGPNAWGILQPIDGGFIGYDLSMTEDGKDVGVMFGNPTSGASGIIRGPTISIKNGGVYNGVSDDSLVDVSYQLLGGDIHTTPLVPPGEETGPLLTGQLVSFSLSLAGNPTASTWYPAEGFVMAQDMALVVTGTYSTPALAIMVPVGPVKIVVLTHVHPG